MRCRRPYSVKKEEFSDSYFAFSVQAKPGKLVNIWQPKKEDEKHFIHLAARVDLDKELRSSVAKLSAKKRLDVPRSSRALPKRISLIDFGDRTEFSLNQGFG